MTGRQLTRTGLAALAAAAVAATVFAVPAQAEERPTVRHAATQQAFDTLVKSGLPGVTGQARDAKGVWKGASGVGNLKTGKARGKDDRFRIGSITKTFVATVLLQLEAEGKLDLDDTVEKHLPGLVTGNGNDGSTITVRQLLNHTSGLYNYTSSPSFTERYFFASGFFENRYTSVAPETWVKEAMTQPPNFTPGARHEYSNTNYILAGLVLEKVTGDSYENQVRKRIVKPLGLTATTAPGDSPRMPKPSGRGYSVLADSPTTVKVYDVTELNPSVAWAAGDMISSAGDLNRFFSALMRGKLIPNEQLKAMKTTVSGYGLGIATDTLGCGVTLWGHGGGIHGSGSSALTTEDGRHTLAYNVNGDWGGDGDPVGAEFCGTKAKKGTSAKGSATLTGTGFNSGFADGFTRR
ncbi:D-alanyl-D-alanine carboxypeptidase [Streptomyces inusitatus]|uniref:D-alanyl-D-alanine carboxypeptidase n=1 Tax=Streptomyces inusitatus TaxID=68221 RepID=A0A918V2F6_9ACTN|nr:serine hydrolase domain-containing protein [Streptomyces inusitatus]GGZ58345.1 D-alanyl-D-alanine carboxypeptidase [Streptomyces inusitatus]